MFIEIPLDAQTSFSYEIMCGAHDGWVILSCLSFSGLHSRLFPWHYSSYHYLRIFSLVSLESLHKVGWAYDAGTSILAVADLKQGYLCILFIIKNNQRLYW